MTLAEYKYGDRTYLFDEADVPKGAELIAKNVEAEQVILFPDAEEARIAAEQEAAEQAAVEAAEKEAAEKAAAEAAEKEAADKAAAEAAEKEAADKAAAEKAAPKKANKAVEAPANKAD